MPSRVTAGAVCLLLLASCNRQHLPPLVHAPVPAGSTAESRPLRIRGDIAPGRARTDAVTRYTKMLPAADGTTDWSQPWYLHAVAKGGQVLTLLTATPCHGKLRINLLEGLNLVAVQMALPRQAEVGGCGGTVVTVRLRLPLGERPLLHAPLVPTGR